MSKDTLRHFRYDPILVTESGETRRDRKHKAVMGVSSEGDWVPVVKYLRDIEALNQRIESLQREEYVRYRHRQSLDRQLTGEIGKNTRLEAALSEAKIKIASLEGHNRDWQIVLEQLGFDGESSTRDVKAHLDELRGYEDVVCRQDQKISDLETELENALADLRQLKEKKKPFSLLRWLGLEIRVD